MAKINLQQFSFIILLINLFSRASAQQEVKGQTVDTSNKISQNESTDSYFSTIDINSTSSFIIGQTFETFDLNTNRVICIYEFGQLCQALFQDADHKSYSLDTDQIKELYDTFDVNHDKKIDVREFRQCWDRWVKKILRPVSAYIVIDVQNDFVTGSLAVRKFGDRQNGAEVIEPTNKLVEKVPFHRVYYSLDWHPENHISFIDNIRLRPLDNSSKIQNPDEAKVLDTVIFAGNPPTEQTLWPKHCVQNSYGAELHSNLVIPDNKILVYKGQNPDIDSYSAIFENDKIHSTTLVAELKENGITDCYFSGLAYDVCVGASAMDTLDLGYRTMIIDDASRGIFLKNVETTKENVKKAHGLIVNSHEVEAMVQGKDRRPQLAMKLALEIRKKGGIILPD